GASRRRSRSRPGRPGKREYRVVMPWSSDHQALHRFPTHEMRVDDVIDIALVDIGVPDAFRVDDHDRPFLAAVQAAGLVDAHLACSRESQLLDALLRIFLHGLCIAVGATGAIGPGRALVQTEKYVVTVVAHCGSPAK